MQSEAAQHQSEQIGEAEYQTLAQTLMESDRGRRFLKEFVRRNRTPETQEILAAIKRLEKTVGQGKSVPNIDNIKLDIADMAEAIERTKNEISSIKAEGESSNRFTNASMELDAIVKHTEGATQPILEAAEQLQEQAWILRENGADNAVCDIIDEKATEIFMACSFQDLTGQRTNKVVQVLGYLESRINYIIGLWGIGEVTEEDMAAPEDTRPDSHLLNGPQMEGEGVSQDNIDELMNVSADVFDAALDASSGGADAADEVADDAGDMDMEAPMDAADIDSMFASVEVAEETSDAEDVFAEDVVAEETEVAEVEVEFEVEAEAEAEAEAEVEVDAQADESADFSADDILDESEIDKLFDAETQSADDAADDVEAEIEAEADADWEQTEIEAGDSDADPLEKLSESERQALFN